MVKDIRVRPEGCLYEPTSDISPNWKDMRSEFEYTTLYAIDHGMPYLYRLFEKKKKW